MSSILSTQSRLRKHGITQPYSFSGVNSPLLISYVDFLDNSLREVNSRRIRSVCDFLSTTDQELRQGFAEKMIKIHWQRYGKDLYSFFLDKLMTSQLGMKLFDRYQRDHVSHLAYVFLLGLHLYSADKDIRDAFRSFQYLERMPSEMDQFFFMWNVISTFHDLGLPFEGFSKEMCSYILMLNSLQETDRKTSSFSLSLNNLDLLSDNRSSFEIINEVQMKHSEKNNYFDIQRYFKYKLQAGVIDHGVLSALLLYKITDNIYAKKEWNRKVFNRLFPEIALAIAIHNIDWNSTASDMGIARDTLPAITLQDFPFCYLLILADSLQEWDRPSLARPSLPPTGVSITYSEDEMRFNIELALGKEEIEKVEHNLQSKISTSDGKPLPAVAPAIINY